MTPLLVIEGSQAAVRAARSALQRRGWRVVDGWLPVVPRRGPSDAAGGPHREIRAGVISSTEDAANAVLTALGGSGLLVDARADPEVVDSLCEDLRRFGPVDHRMAADSAVPTGEQQDVLAALLDGATVAQVALRLHLSRRTVDRRLAEVRAFYRVASTAAALAAARRCGDL